MILNGFLINQHSAHKNKREDKEPKSGDGKVDKQRLQRLSFELVYLTLKYIADTKKVMA